MNEFPNTVISASGLDVGLPKNQAGNSEVGHMNIGAGRIVKQNFVRINESIFNNESDGSSIREQIQLIAFAPFNISSSLSKIAPLMSISYPLGSSGGFSLASLISI